MEKTLYRSARKKVIAGVAGGLAEYFDIDPVIVRVIFIVAALGWGVSILAYFIFWVIIPKAPENLAQEPIAFAGEGVTEPEAVPVIPDKHTKRKYAFAVILIIIGSLGLIHNILPEFGFRIIFPLIIIAVGAAILLREPLSFNKRKAEVL